MTKFALIALGLPAMLLAACVETSTTTTVAPKSAFPIGADDTCGAASYVSLIGQPAADAKAISRRNPVRVLEEGGIMSLEYNASRLNFRTSAAGRVSELFCG